MKKTTINAILLSIITLMSVSICFLIFCIVTRPRYVTVNEQETAATITEVTDLSEAPPQQSEPPSLTTIPRRLLRSRPLTTQCTVRLPQE